MDPSSVPVDEIGNIIKLLGSGGNVALITLAIIAWQVWKTVRDVLFSIRDSILGIRTDAQRNHEDTMKAQRRIGRALAASSLDAQKSFDRDMDD